MSITLTGLITSLLRLALAVRVEWAVLAVIALWGTFAFAIPPIMQDGVVKVAQNNVR